MVQGPRVFDADDGGHKECAPCHGLSVRILPVYKSFVLVRSQSAMSSLPADLLFEIAEFVDQPIALARTVRTIRSKNPCSSS